MKAYAVYDATHEESLALLDAQALARLVTVDAEGWPRVGLHVFTRQAGTVEFHLERGDPHLEDLARHARAVVEVDEVLASVPSHWIDPADGSHADQFYLTASFRATTEVVDDAAAVGLHLGRLLERYQPEGGYRPVVAGEAFYAPSIARLVVVRCTLSTALAKFKVGQKTSRAARATIAAALEARGSHVDVRSAAILRARTPGSGPNP